MIKLLTIVGARPQFIKAAVLSNYIKLNCNEQCAETMIHTGQHYDTTMSQIFFDELNMFPPSYNLNIHGDDVELQQIKMTNEIMKIIEHHQPDVVLVYGDTTSTKAGAIAAARCNKALAHVEAGMRSFNPNMPEEENRITADKLSQYLFCASSIAVQNLANEGISHGQHSYPKVIFTGDIMYDACLFYSQYALSLPIPSFVNGDYILTSIHRNFNTDDAIRLQQIVEGLCAIKLMTGMQIIWPLHPRTAKQLQKFNINVPAAITTVAPLSYLQMLQLQHLSKLVITDSGGVQKESYFLKKPCVIIREETEWSELVTNGNNKLSDVGAFAMCTNVDSILQQKKFTFPEFYGRGNASAIIMQALINSHK